MNTTRANDAPGAEPPSRVAPGAENPALGRHLVSLVSPRSFEAEQYRILRHAIEQRHRDAALRTVAVTSPGGAEGKTTTSINLAGALAQARDARVILMEADLRRPSMLRQLGLDTSGPGLVEAVLDSDFRLEAIVRKCPAYHLDVAPCGTAPLAPYEVLKSPRFGVLVEQARQDYDYVILDTAPIVPCPDYRLIEKWIDGTLLVVAAHRTSRSMVDAALALLDSSRFLGLVFNGDSGRSGYQDQYYAMPGTPPRTPGHWLGRLR